MSITDELREWASLEVPYKYGHQLTAIADRIDAEHESACAEAYGNGVESVALPDMTAYVKLPVDADGAPWHLGDVTENGNTVRGLVLDEHGWYFVGTVNDIDPSIHRHYRAPTVEDILTEFGIDWEHESDCEDRAALLKEYAAKFRLADEEE